MKVILIHRQIDPSNAGPATFGVPDSGPLRAQVPFGANQGGFGEKNYRDDAQRLSVAG